ncbi:hypothetical protein P171DRAFT_491229 [Karstenula rhodostoma CBS 690.94]|uniref:Uncharacterized protein n=1 Tax=Karstenula rhodostoma CBS 690.94 TaxID=1392251 RepID=A0A9P4P707_9PLEO|nr:hypothetical protein P171DRAFT_491229 [Karstenula rhodostoma CBS 690.94]
MNGGVEDLSDSEPKTWRMKIGKTKERPIREVWAVSHCLVHGQLQLYYYNDPMKASRVQQHELDLNTVPARFLSDKGTFSTAKVHDAWLERYKNRLGFAELSKIPHQEFLERIAKGEDALSIRKAINLVVPNRKKNGRHIPDDWNTDNDHRQERLMPNDGLSAQEIMN